jgi:hypothetical protein
MRVRISRSKPFITDSTTIISATPSTRPATASRETKDTRRLPLPARNSRQPIHTG